MLMLRYLRSKCFLFYVNIRNERDMAQRDRIIVYRILSQLSADIKTKFVRFKGPKTKALKTGINFMFFFILIFIENCLQYDAIHESSVWLRTGSNPAVSKPYWKLVYNVYNIKDMITDENYFSQLIMMYFL